MWPINKLIKIVKIKTSILHFLQLGSNIQIIESQAFWSPRRVGIVNGTNGVLPLPYNAESGLKQLDSEQIYYVSSGGKNTFETKQHQRMNQGTR